LGAAASVATALMMTRYYESRTLIAYKEAVNKDRVFSGEEHQRAQNWLRTQLDETFSSHTLRMKIINDLDLFPGERESMPPEVLLEEFSRKVAYDLVGSDTFWISFEYKDPRKAQQGAARLAEEFVHKQVGDKLYVAQATLTFMEKEVTKAKGEMDKIESDMAEFVSEHPQYQIDPTTGLPRGTMAGTSTGQSYASVSNPELRRALARKGQLEAKLQLMLNPQGNTKVVEARQLFERAKTRLLALRRQYTDRHPDVQRARAYARQMQQQLNMTMQSHKGNSGQVAAVREEIESLDRSISRLSRRQRPRSPEPDRPKRQLSHKAEMEKRFYQLSRDREVAKAKYEQLQTQLLRSKVSSNLERKQAETQFIIVDKANLPRKPSRPSRTKLALAGTALGMMLGLGLAVLLVIFDPRIYSEDDLRKACDLPVLAQIPRDA
jgi:succinoglycan biosynthesis transport protein ExoP